jgi:hypothetical protein
MDKNNFEFDKFLNELIEKQNIELIKEICRKYKKNERRMIIDYYSGKFN